VIVHDLDVGCLSWFEPEADAPLFVYTDTVLACPVAGELFKRGDKQVGCDLAGDGADFAALTWIFHHSVVSDEIDG